MARKKDQLALGVLGAAALVVGGVVKFFQTYGFMIPLLILASLVGVVLWYRHGQKQRRLAALRAKYHDEDTVQKIMRGCFWQGQSGEQLVDALGNPHAIDEKILKTKKKEIWKYQHRGANRFGLRITLENDFVIGWEQNN